jgi:hypothetical protein
MRKKYLVAHIADGKRITKILSAATKTRNIQPYNDNMDMGSSLPILSLNPSPH